MSPQIYTYHGEWTQAYIDRTAYWLDGIFLDQHFFNLHHSQTKNKTYTVT